MTTIRYKLSVAAFFAAGMGFAAAGSAMSTEELGLATARDSQAFPLLTELTETIGPRMSATEKGAAAERFVFERLRAFGLKDVRYESFNMLSWTRGSIALSVEGRPIAAAAMVYTPAEADFTGEIADIGNGTSSDYAADYDKVRGRIALIYMGTLPGSPADTVYLPRWERLALAIGHGARAVLFINPAAGNHLVTGITGGSARMVDIPAAVVSREDGLDLRQQLKAGRTLRASLSMRNTVKPGVARNVIATITGSEKPEQTVVLGGHLDSLDLGAGAVDNGSGAMWILDVARAFARHHIRPQRTVQFIFFMGEEEGLLGSYAHVRKALKDSTLAQVRYMINTDMSVNPHGLYLWGGDLDARFFLTFAAAVRKIYPSFTEISTDMADMSQSSDSQPFIEQGVPIVYPTAQWPDGLMACIHAECDRIGFLDDSQMRRSAVVGAMLLKALADAPDDVAHVMSAAETLDYFKAAKITRSYLGPAETH